MNVNGIRFERMAGRKSGLWDFPALWKSSGIWLVEPRSGPIRSMLVEPDKWSGMRMRNGSPVHPMVHDETPEAVVSKLLLIEERRKHTTHGVLASALALVAWGLVWLLWQRAQR